MTASIWPQTMIVVEDVEAASKLYCDIFGFVSAHGGNEYDQLAHNGEMVMQLHDTNPDDNHAGLRDLANPAGNGVLLWFEVTDFDGTVDRARAHGVSVIADVHINPNAKQPEFWFRDPDGYTVVVAGESEYRPRSQS